MNQISEAPLSIMLEQSAVALETGISVPAAFKALQQVQQDPACRELAAMIGQTPLTLLPAALARKQADPNFDLPPAELNSLQLCLLLAQNTGTALSSLFNTLAENLRDQTDASRARQSAFAGAQVTAKILLALPLASLALGYAIGANPLQVLLGDIWGWFMLITGVLLTLLGWFWMRRLLQSAAGDQYSFDQLLLVDLLAQVIMAGLPLPKALYSIGNCLKQVGAGQEATGQITTAASVELIDLSQQFETAAQLLMQGSPIHLALANLPDQLQAITDSAALSTSTGAQLAPLLIAAGKHARRAQRREVERVSAALAVKLVLPTGVAILPAFVVLGIIPVITDLLANNFG